MKSGMITIDDFAKVEIRVGKVVQAENVEGSAKLIRLQVDFGPSFVKAMEGKEEKPRVIFTGVRGFGYTPEDFAGKRYLFVVNLEPKKMMDEESQGMILAVDGEELPFGKHVEKKPVFVSADGLPLGAQVR